MIVLDEQLMGRGLETAIGAWYPGAVRFIHELRPGGVVKDDAVPTLLDREKLATFVTINVTDFWERIPASERYCVVCIALPDTRAEAIPGMLRSLFRREGFRTKAARMGRVVRLSTNTILYYSVKDRTVRNH